MKGATWPPKSTSWNDWMAFCHFICGHHVTDHCSQQPNAPVVSRSRSAKSPCAHPLPLDKVDLLGVVCAKQRVDLGHVALAAAHHEAELLGREALVVPLVVPAEAPVREPPDDQQSEQRRETAEQDGELESDHGVGGNS